MRIVPYIALLNTRMIGPTPSSIDGRQLLPGHHEAAIAAKPDDQAVGMDELGGDRGGHAVAHRAAGRPELPPRPAVLQKAVRPAAEIAGVAGDDRVIGQAVAQPGHDLAEIERRPPRCGRARAPPRIPRAPPRASSTSAAPRTGCRAAAAAANSGMPDWIARVGRNTRPSSSARGMDMDQHLAGVGDAEQRVGLRGDLADPRADRQHADRPALIRATRAGLAPVPRSPTKHGEPVVDDVLAAERAADRELVGLGEAGDVARRRRRSSRCRRPA